MAILNNIVVIKKRVIVKSSDIKRLHRYKILHKCSLRPSRADHSLFLPYCDCNAEGDFRP